MNNQSNDAIRANELLSIGEFAGLVGATRSQLLFYDKKGIFSPKLRKEMGDQAANRYYAIDQVYDFLTLTALQGAGCSLEETGCMLSSNLTGRQEFLNEKLEQLKKEEERIRRSREGVALVLKMENISQKYSIEAPCIETLEQGIGCCFTPFDENCVRGTRSFADALIHAIKENLEREDTLSLPFGIVYNSRPIQNGQYPVKGFVSLLREDKQEQPFFVLKGKVMFFGITAEISKFKDYTVRFKSMLQAMKLIRTTPLIGWNMNVEEKAGKMLYTECVTFGVTEGETAEGERPVLPNVD